MREQLIPYDADAAVAYAKRWAYERNPKFLDFEGLGGDCTNFVSQCVYAGAWGVMNFKPVFGWYYITASERTASWTGVQFFYDFMISNVGAGPQVSEVDISELRAGDVIQLGYESGLFYHTLLVVRIRPSRKPSYNDIFTSSHSEDSFMRALSTYSIYKTRFLHIEGVGRPATENYPAF